MKTVITGGAGFIGSHLTEHLLAAGDEVTVLDNLSTGSRDNLANVEDHPNFRFIEGSILERDAVIKLVSKADRVFHLAAAVGVHLIVDHPLESLRTNIHGTEVVLDACREANASLLLASTSEIYGKNTADALHEESDRVLGSPLKSRWTYAAAKGIDEAFAHAYWRQFGLRVSIIRLFNTVGPRQTGRYGMVVPNLVGQALRGEPLTVFGDGTQTRCFTFVDDTVRGTFLAGMSSAVDGTVINLGNPYEISILELADLVRNLVGADTPLAFIPYEERFGKDFEDTGRRVPDVTRAKELLGWEPTVDLDEGLGRTLEWWKQTFS